MSALLAQNPFLQGQLTTPSRFDGEASASSQDGVAMRDESPIAIRGGGGDSEDDASGQPNRGWSLSSSASVEGDSLGSHSRVGGGSRSLFTMPQEHEPALLPTGEPNTLSPPYFHSLARMTQGSGGTTPRKRHGVEEERGPGGPCPWGSTVADRLARQANTR